MKTAISMPDDTFAQVEQRAHELGMSRSEFLTTAARHYLAQLDEDELTRAIDDAVALVADDEPGSVAAAAGRRRLAAAGADDEW